MPYTIEKMPDVPVLLLAVETRQITQELDRLIADLVTFLNLQPEPVFLVLDVTGAVVSVDDLTASANLMARGPITPLHHPNIRESLMVSPDGIIRLTVKGLKSPAFGSVRIRAFDTIGEAFDYVGEQLSIEPGRKAGADS